MSDPWSWSNRHVKVNDREHMSSSQAGHTLFTAQLPLQTLGSVFPIVYLQFSSLLVIFVYQ